jgi:hypothetical protein
MRGVVPVHLLAVSMRLPAVATIAVAMVAAHAVRVPAVSTAAMLALRVAVDVAVPVDLVAVPVPCPGTLCVATGPASVVAVTPHHRRVGADGPTLSICLGQVSRALAGRERGGGAPGNGRQGHGLPR